MSFQVHFVTVAVLHLFRITPTTDTDQSVEALLLLLNNYLVLGFTVGDICYYYRSSCQSAAVPRGARGDALPESMNIHGVV